MKNDFYVLFKVFFVLEIITFLFWHFGYVGKWLVKKKLWFNFKIYDVMNYTKNNYEKNYTISREVKTIKQ